MLSLLTSIALSRLHLDEPVTLTLAQDTVIVRDVPDANKGREPVLSVGTGRVLLIRFPELGLRHGRGARAKSATLTFSLASATSPAIESVHRLLKPWQEGGVFVSAFDNTVVPSEPGDATWTSAMKGLSNWQNAGARGPEDAELLAEAKAKIEDGRITLTGLERAVNAWLNAPWSNFGLRVEFRGESSVMSADAFSGGPQLQVEFSKQDERQGPDLALVRIERGSAERSWVAVISNMGDADSDGGELSVSIDGRPATSAAVTTVAKGGEVRVPFLLEGGGKGSGAVMKGVSVWIAPKGADTDRQNDGTVFYPQGLPVAVSGVSAEQALAWVTEINEIVFPLSKYASAPRGCVERLRLAGDGEASVVRLQCTDLEGLIGGLAGVTERLARPYTGTPPLLNGVAPPAFTDKLDGLGQLPDTRDDVLIPRFLPIPEPSDPGTIEAVPMASRGLVSRSETNLINALAGKTGADRSLPWSNVPPNVMFTVRAVSRTLPEDTKIDVYQLTGGFFGSAPVFSSPVGADGTALMTGRPTGGGKPSPFGSLSPDAGDSWLLAVVSGGGGTTATWLPVWKFWDEFARGNKAVAFIDLPLKPESKPFVPGENVAVGRLVTDSKGRFPAELSAMVDGDPRSGVNLKDEPAGYWIEIDLGRDKEIAEIVLEFNGEPWTMFNIVTYKTAQSPSDSQVWQAETNGKNRATTLATGNKVLRYQSRPVRSRFVRIVPVSQEAVSLSEIMVNLRG